MKHYGTFPNISSKNPSMNNWEVYFDLFEFIFVLRIRLFSINQRIAGISIKQVIKWFMISGRYFDILANVMLLFITWDVTLAFYWVYTSSAVLQLTSSMEVDNNFLLGCFLSYRLTEF